MSLRGTHTGASFWEKATFHVDWCRLISSVSHSRRVAHSSGYAIQPILTNPIPILLRRSRISNTSSCWRSGASLEARWVKIAFSSLSPEMSPSTNIAMRVAMGSKLITLVLWGYRLRWSMRAVQRVAFTAVCRPQVTVPFPWRNVRNIFTLRPFRFNPCSMNAAISRSSSGVVIASSESAKLMEPSSASTPAMNQ